MYVTLCSRERERVRVTVSPLSECEREMRNMYERECVLQSSGERERGRMRASASEIESVRLTVSVIDTLFVRE